MPDLVDLADLQLSAADANAVRTLRLRLSIIDIRGNVASGVAATLIIATVVSSNSHAGMEAWTPWFWWLAYALIGLGLIRSAERFRAGAQTDAEVLARGKQLLPLIAAAGIVWGAAVWLMLPTSAWPSELILVLGCAMTLMGVATGRGGDRASTQAFAIPCTALFAAGLVRIGDLFHVAVGIGFVVFTGALLSYARLHQRAIEAAVHWRLRAERLLAERTAQQREAEHARQEAERAREMAIEANSAKTYFLAAAGHDLRQPMHSLAQYYGQLLHTNKDASLSPVLRHFGGAMEAMHGLLDSVLDVSQLLSGTIKPATTVFRIAALLERLEAQTRPVAEEKRLRLLVQPANVAVCSDEVLLERLLRNLVVNALHYTELGTVTLRACVRGGRLHLVVADTGIGIPPAERERIFDAYFQGSGGVRDSRMGLGLGLAIVRHLARLLEVRLAFRSRLGVGTVFRLSLPAFADFEGAEPFGDEVCPGVDYTRGAFVVVIDDESECREATSSSLSQLGCKVVSAASSSEALALLDAQEQLPQLIVADCRLGTETGVAAVDRVLGRLGSRFGAEFQVAVLFLSGEVGEEAPDGRLDGRVLLRKPLRFVDLQYAVNRELARVAESG